MCFGKTEKKKLDIRIRITNGNSEVVMKAGPYGSHDRTELAQQIDSAQFIGMVRLFAQLDFEMKYGERETTNYSLPDEVTVSVVSAGDIAYIELEKMSSESDVDANGDALKKIGNELALKFLDEGSFDAL
jgi:hypothetical protein